MCDEIPVPEFTHSPDLEINKSMMDCPESETTNGDSSASEYEGASYTQEQFNQTQLNDLVRDLALSKELSEVLASRLNEKKCLGSGTKITFYRYREQKLLQYLTKKNDLVYCNNVQELLLEMGIPTYNPQEWRLFLDSSKVSLKCVLLHNGNSYA